VKSTRFAPIRRDRSHAWREETGADARDHEHDAGLQRPPTEHVLLVERVRDVEHRRAAEQEQRADVRADERRRPEEREPDERLVDRPLDHDERPEQDGADAEDGDALR
jgi:hypothetical protein